MREKMARFEAQFRRRQAEHRMPASLGIDAASSLTLLLKYMSGRLPLSEFELDFGVQGTAPNMLHLLFTWLDQGINRMARSVDAIKHQAKTVTVAGSVLRQDEKLALGCAMAALNHPLTVQFDIA